jgi:hypothetical protein
MKAFTNLVRGILVLEPEHDQRRSKEAYLHMVWIGGFKCTKEEWRRI